MYRISEIFILVTSFCTSTSAFHTSQHHANTVFTVVHHSSSRPFAPSPLRARLRDVTSPSLPRRRRRRRRRRRPVLSPRTTNAGARSLGLSVTHSVVPSRPPRRYTRKDVPGRGFGLDKRRDALYDDDEDEGDDDDDHDWSVCFDDDDVDTGVRGRHG